MEKLSERYFPNLHPLLLFQSTKYTIPPFHPVPAIDSYRLASEFTITTSQLWKHLQEGLACSVIDLKVDLGSSVLGHLLKCSLTRGSGSAVGRGPVLPVLSVVDSAGVLCAVEVGCATSTFSIATTWSEGSATVVVGSVPLPLPMLFICIGSASRRRGRMLTRISVSGGNARTVVDTECESRWLKLRHVSLRDAIHVH